MRPDTTSELEDFQLVFRANAVARYGGPCLAAFWSVASIALVDGELWSYLTVLAVPLAVWVNWSRRVVILDNTLFEHDVRWSDPVLLDHLVSVRLMWSFWERRLPRRVLRLIDRTGTHVDVAVGWLERRDELIRTVAEISGLAVSP